MGIYLVTGGAGFIGSHLAHALVERGGTIRVLDNLVTGNRKNLAAIADRVEFIEADLVNRGAVERALDGVEVVFHQAAFSLSPAARHYRFVCLDGVYLLGFGPVTALAELDLARALYP